MSKAETMECVDCSGRGFRGVLGGLCPTCNGTGIVTTGKILGTLPSTPDPVTDEPHEPTITTTQGDAPSVVTGNGLRYVYAPGHDSGATVTDERDATIAEQAAEIERLEGEPIRGMQRLQAETIREQAAEIERLRGELNERGEALTMAEMSLMETDEEVKGLRADRDNWKKLFTDHLAVESQLRAKLAEATLIDAPELRTERDTLRLENQRLNDLSFEAQDRYAALEAERDALRGELDTAIASRDAAGLINSRQRWKDRADLLASEIAEVRVRWQEDRKERVALGGELRIASEDRDAANARVDELRAERDALKDRVDGLERLHGEWADGSLAELTAERDALRLAVDHLKAEQDELKGKLDVQQEFIDDYRKTIDRLRTEVERLKGERDSVKHNFASLVAATEQGVDRIRAEKYAAVIAAQSDMIEAQERHNEIALRLSQAYSVAGFATDVLQVGDVPRVKEADRD